jgi:hypothetical protein
MNKILRRVMATVSTMALLSPMIVQAGPASHPRNEDAALSLLLRLSTTAFMRVAFHWIASLSLPKKRQTHTFSSFCGKITPLRAAAIRKLVLSSTATAFIARLEKLNGWNRLKIIGCVTTQRKSDSARGNETLPSVIL